VLLLPEEPVCVIFKPFLPFSAITLLYFFQAAAP